MLFGGAPIVPFIILPKKEFYKESEKKPRLNIKLDHYINSDSESDISDYDNTDDDDDIDETDGVTDIEDVSSNKDEYDLIEHLQSLLPDELVNGKPTKKDLDTSYLEDLRYKPKPTEYFKFVRFIYSAIKSARIRERERRKHYILREYEMRVKEYDEKRRQGILDRMQQQRNEVLLEAYRTEQRRAQMSKKKFNLKQAVNTYTQDLDRRDKETRITEFYANTLTKWGVEAINNAHARSIEQEKHDQLMRQQNKARRKEERRLKLIEDDAKFVAEDMEVANEMETMMLKYGMIGFDKEMDVSEEDQIKQLFKQNKAMMVVDSQEKERNELKLTAGDMFMQTYLRLTMKRGLDMVQLRKVLRKNIHKRKKDQSIASPFKEDLSGSGQISYLKAENIQEAGALYFASELTRGACATLQTLVIKDCRVGSFGLGRILQGIKAGNLQSLRVLNLRGNFIRAEGLEYMKEICTSGVFMNLQVIDLRDNELGDEGIGVLVEMILSGHFMNIVDIDVQHNSITDLGFKKVVDVLKSLQVTRCPLLKRFHLENNLISGTTRRRNAPYPSYFSL